MVCESEWLGAEVFDDAALDCMEGEIVESFCRATWMRVQLIVDGCNSLLKHRLAGIAFTRRILLPDRYNRNSWEFLCGRL